MVLWGIKYVQIGIGMCIDQGISIEYVLGIQYSEKVLVLDIQYIMRRSIGKSINTFRLEIQYPILFSGNFSLILNKKFVTFTQNLIFHINKIWKMKTLLQNHYFDSIYSNFTMKISFWAKIT